MAIFRCEAKIIGREKRGRSVVAAAAYRTGEKLYGEREGKIHDFSRRSRGVIRSVILSPEEAPDWTKQSSTLWNGVEAHERRADAQLAREFVLSLPKELSADQQFELAENWARHELVEQGMIVQISLHHSRDGKNPHAHLLCTMRRLDGEKFAPKKARDWNDVTLLLAQRESWAYAVNDALEKAGTAQRVDHRSLKDRGLDRLPEPKVGPTATAMKRKGLLPDPRKLQELRFVKTLNDVMPQMRSLKMTGEVRQMGHGGTWWDKSVNFLNRVKDQARETVVDAWNAMLEPWRRMKHEHEADKSKGLDLDR